MTFPAFLTIWKLLSKVSSISNIFGWSCSGEECINTIGRFRQLIVTRKWKRNGTSVTSISTDNDGPSEYYNLNGQRITAPADKRQLYIERRNGKATVRVRR